MPGRGRFGGCPHARGSHEAPPVPGSSLSPAPSRAPVPAGAIVRARTRGVHKYLRSATRSSAGVVVDYNVHFGGGDGDGAAWRREPWERASQTVWPGVHNAVDQRRHARKWLLYFGCIVYSPIVSTGCHRTTTAGQTRTCASTRGYSGVFCARNSVRARTEIARHHASALSWTPGGGKARRAASRAM